MLKPWHGRNAGRFYPADLDVISWLGACLVKSEAYEKAVQYFQQVRARRAGGPMVKFDQN